MRPVTPFMLDSKLSSRFGSLAIQVGTYYRDSTPAIMLICAEDNLSEEIYAGEPAATLTYSPSVPTELADDELCVKTWNGNELITGAALASDLFERTGRRCADGMGEVWRMKGELLSKFMELINDADEPSSADEPRG